MISAHGGWAADDPGAAYPAAGVSVVANHESIAQQWYALLAGSQPMPQPMVLRLNMPRCSGSTSLALELVYGTGMPLDARVWETSRRITLYAADCTKLTVTGTPDSGSIGGECWLLLPDDVSGTTNRMRIELNGTMVSGKVHGSFRAFVMAAKTDGVLTGAALASAAAAKSAPVRGLPAMDFAGKRPSEIYAAATVLEHDSIHLYRQFRALAAVKGDRSLFGQAFLSNDVPWTVRKSFDSAAASSPKQETVGRRATVLKPVEKKEKTLDFDMDAIGGTGLDAEPAAVKSPPPQGSVKDKPESIRAMLPAMHAMCANTAWIRGAETAHMSSGAAAAAVERGLKFEDPLFGPWYGSASLASWTGRVNRLPAGVGSAAIQDWPFVHGWQSAGPFDLGTIAWDPVHLPECMPVADTEYSGKVGPAWWKRAPVMPSGCVMLTDLDSYQAAADAEDQQPSGRPAKAPGNKHVYFAETTIESDRDAEVLFAAGCTGYILVWHDGVLAASGPRTETPENILDEMLMFRLNLHRGRNSILIRCESEAYGLFSHRRAGTASYVWMRACTGASPRDPQASKAWLDEVARRKKDLPNLPANVRGFRGDQTGFFADADPVTAWDIDKGINVKWITPIERWSKGSPIVVGGKVFVCADPNVLVCLDAATGKILWRRAANVLELIDPAEFKKSEQLHQAFLDAKAAADQKLGEIGPDYGARLRALEARGVVLPQAVADMRAMQGDVERKYSQFLGHLCSVAKASAPAWDGHYSVWWLGYTFGTPVTDGKRVYFKSHAGVTAAYDLDGNRAWMVRTPFPVGGTTVCMSPVVADDKVVVASAPDPRNTEATLCLTALDAATGRTVWTVEADSKSQISSPVVMRLTDGRQDMTVIVTDGGTVVRADDGKVLVTGLRGGSGSGTPTPVGDTLYRVERRQGGGVQLIMLDRDHVGARWTWHRSLYNAVYAGVGHHAGILFGTTHGGSQYMNERGLDLIDAATGLPVDRPFNLPDKTNRKGIFTNGRFGFIPPTASPRAIYIALRGPSHASSLAEELPNKWTPYTYVSVAQHGGLGRFVAHNKVVAPLTPHLAMDGDRLYVRNDYELTCFGYTGDEGRAYEAEVNAATILEDIPDEPPADAEGKDLWKKGILHAKPFLEKAISLKPSCAAAARAKALLEKTK
jgi:outer membrane protein assembly factor BamB